MTQAVTLAQAGNSNGTFRNKIINGAMMIDQRNAGASVTPTANAFTVDRWNVNDSASGVFTVQQNAGSVTPPAGFTNYLGVTSLAATSVSSGANFTIRHQVEGFNWADTAWGTASAKPVTLSFWIRSSLTGTFGVCFENAATNRSYPTTYTINSANTWEYKTITIPGDTSGPWSTDNGCGVRIWFGLGTGSTYAGAPGSWQAADYRGTSGCVNVVSTSGATWYLTGVQCEIGTTASAFEFRSYSKELMMCQRYCEIIRTQESGNETLLNIAFVYSNPNIFWNYPYKVTKRAIPSLTLVGSSTAFQCLNTAGNWIQANSITFSPNQHSTRINTTMPSFSGFTTGNACETRCDYASASLGRIWIEAEL